MAPEIGQPNDTTDETGNYHGNILQNGAYVNGAGSNQLTVPYCDGGTCPWLVTGFPHAVGAGNGFRDSNLGVDRDGGRGRQRALTRLRRCSSCNASRLIERPLEPTAQARAG